MLSCDEMKRPFKEIFDINIGGNDLQRLGDDDYLKIASSCLLLFLL